MGWGLLVLSCAAVAIMVYNMHGEQVFIAELVAPATALLPRHRRRLRFSALARQVLLLQRLLHSQRRTALDPHQPFTCTAPQRSALPRTPPTGLGKAHGRVPARGRAGRAAHACCGAEEGGGAAGRDSLIHRAAAVGRGVSAGALLPHGCRAALPADPQHDVTR